jgi:serine/threonine protein kinase
MVAKFSTKTEEIAREIRVAKSLRKSKNVIKMLDYDIIILTNFEDFTLQTCGYYVMPLYESYQGCPFDMTKQLLTALEGLHGIGRTHNDLKPDNVLMDSDA